MFGCITKGLMFGFAVAELVWFFKTKAAVFCKISWIVCALPLLCIAVAAYAALYGNLHCKKEMPQAVKDHFVSICFPLTADGLCRVIMAAESFLIFSCILSAIKGDWTQIPLAA